MWNNQLDFDFQKAVETLLYIANRQTDPTFMRVAKLMYFADKTSLENYGRFITGDTYYAMENGPVPTETYNLMKAGRDSEQYGFKVISNHHIRPLREADVDELSDSDIECLEQVLTVYGKLPTWDLRNLSHDTAYNTTWREAGEQGSTPIPLDRVASQFDNAEELLAYLNGDGEE